MCVVTRKLRGRSVRRCVDLCDIAFVLMLGIAALSGHFRSLSRIVEVGETGVVELKVCAAACRDLANLPGVGRR